MKKKCSERDEKKKERCLRNTAEINELEPETKPPLDLKMRL